MLNLADGYYKLNEFKKKGEMLSPNLNDNRFDLPVK